jgi:hypothetical protein
MSCKLGEARELSKILFYQFTKPCFLKKKQGNPEKKDKNGH